MTLSLLPETIRVVLLENQEGWHDVRCTLVENEDRQHLTYRLMLTLGWPVWEG